MGQLTDSLIHNYRVRKARIVKKAVNCRLHSIHNFHSRGFILSQEYMSDNPDTLSLDGLCYKEQDYHLLTELSALVDKSFLAMIEASS